MTIAVGQPQRRAAEQAMARRTGQRGVEDGQGDPDEVMRKSDVLGESARSLGKRRVHSTRLWFLETWGRDPGEGDRSTRTALKSLTIKLLV